MLDKIKEISVSVSEIISRITSLNELGDLRVSYLGKNGEITALLKGLKNFSAEERPVVGKHINELRQKVDAMISECEARFNALQKEKKMKEEEIDVTLSLPDKNACGSLHPLTLAKNELINAFTGMGFSVLEGVEVEEDYYNFQLLNIPADELSTDSVTVGGWTIEKFGGFPKAGDSFTADGVEVVVLAVSEDGLRVEKIMVRLASQ